MGRALEAPTMSESKPGSMRYWLARLANLRLAVIAHDLFMVWAGWLAARAVSVAGSEGFNLPLRALFMPELLMILIIQGAVFWYTGLYRGLWRFASLPDLWNLVKGALAGTLLVALYLWLSNSDLQRHFPQLLLVYPIALVIFLGTPRVLYRSWKDATRLERKAQQQQRTVILGAGHSGAVLLRELQRDPYYLLLGMLDDNPVLRHTRVHGVKVLGALADLRELGREMGVQLAIIAMPGASNEQMQRAVSICEDAGVEIKTLPRLRDLDTIPSMTGKGANHDGDGTALKKLKSVSLEDLLGRASIELDWDALQAGITNQRVLITGAGGSIGSELALLVMRLRPASLSLIDNSEFNLYQLQQKLQSVDVPGFDNERINWLLGDVLDPVFLEQAFTQQQPQMVLHAAAYKHLPMLQFQLRAAMRNNIIGTRRVADAARKHAAATMVLISTDKAVNARNVMGATKRIAELYCYSYNNQHDKEHSSTKFIVVRFGNVLNSTGSVVPLFQQQISAGGPVTVTHPEIRRYFMSVREAGLLILQAAVIGAGGELFVLDMGAPVSIRYLAEQLIRLAGKQPDVDIEIVYTGLRPGEKLNEELFHRHEKTVSTSHDMILQAMPLAPDSSRLTTLIDSIETQLQTDCTDAMLRDLLNSLLRCEQHADEQMVTE
jgi:FlaA1/EpsC-like NDP-sugar epimerase